MNRKPAKLYRSRVVVLVFASLLLSEAVALADSDEPPISIDDIVNAWNARARKVKTLRFIWTEHYVLPRGKILTGKGIELDNPRRLVIPDKKTAFDKSFSLVIDGDKIRYKKLDLTLSTQGRLVPEESVWVFADEEYKKLWFPGETPRFRGNIWSDRHLRMAPGNEVNLAPLLITYRPFHPLLGFFRDFKKRFRVVPGKYMVEGRDCILLREEPWGPAQASLSLYLDPARDFLVMSRVARTNGAVSTRLTFLEYEKKDEDWVPVRWMNIYQEEGEAAARRNAPRVTGFSFGGAVDSHEFELPFPDGTQTIESGRFGGYTFKQADNDAAAARKKRIVDPYERLLQTSTGTPADGLDPRDPARTPRARLADIRLSQAESLRNGSWNCLVVRDDGVEVRMELANERRHPDDPVDVVITEASCNQILFGRTENEELAREELAQQLDRTIESLDDICRLTPTQKQKLKLAWRGDASRYFKRAQELMPRIRKPLDRNAVKQGELDEMVLDVMRESGPLRRLINSGTIDNGSLFAKTLTSTLTAEQEAAYHAAGFKSKASE